MKDDKKEKVATVMKLLSTKKGMEALLEYAKSDAEQSIELFEATLETLQKSRN